MDFSKIISVSALTIIGAGLVLAASAAQAKTDFRVYSYLEGGLDIVNGYSQIPFNNIAASLGRPTFNELDIDSSLYFGCGIDLKYDEIWTYLHYKHLTPSNTATLNTALDTLGQTIPAGDIFAMTSHYQWINFGFGKEYSIVAPCLSWKPTIDVSWVNHLYDFDSPIYPHSKEINSLLTVRMGAQVDYQYGEMWSWNLTLMGSPPLTQLNIYEAKLSVAYHLYEKNNFRIRPYAGIGWLLIDINDKKTLNLHTRYEAKPSLFLGLNFLM